MEYSMSNFIKHNGLVGMTVQIANTVGSFQFI